MAVLFAVFLWWAVVNIDDPIQTKKYLVEVDKDLNDSMIDDFREGIRLKDFECKSRLIF